MRFQQSCGITSGRGKRIGVWALSICSGILTAAQPVLAADREGYTEPYRTIDVAADESGIINEVAVREGDSIREGQTLVTLNSDVHRALLAIAEQNMRAHGRLDAAQAELLLRQERLRKLRSLRSEGHARQEEVDRAWSEVAVAEANVRTAREELITRKLERDKIKTQIERRTIRAPLSGIVTHLHKEQGEFVAPNDPVVLRLVQLDPLLANFNVMSPEAAQLEVGQKLPIRFLTTRQDTQGTIEFISPVTDAESGTTRVKVRIANPDGTFRSGERCRVRIGK